MRKTIAAGLTPAWQQIIQLPELHVGEVNRARRVDWCASGKVLNVGIALHHLGSNPMTVAMIGGPAGTQIRAEFATAGIPSRWVNSKSPTRVCTTILDQASNITTELVENSHPVSPPELEEFHAALTEEKSSNDILILSGSLPDGAPSSFYKDAMSDFAGDVILDVRGEELMETLALNPLVIKPNREELALTVKRPLNTESEVLAAMHSLNQEGAQWVIVTHGKDPVLVTDGSESYQFNPPPVAKVVNPIGCGDCFAAGIGWGIAQGRTVIDSIPLGLAAAAQNITHLLPALVDPTATLEQAKLIQPNSHLSH